MKKTVFTGCVGVLLISTYCLGAQLGNSVDSSSWLQTDISESVPSVTFGHTDEEVSVHFYARPSGIPTPIAGELGADVSVAAGVVVGDYRNVEGLCFRVVRTGGMMADLTVNLTGASGTVWNQRVTTQLSAVDGEISVVNVSIDPSQWKTFGRTADSSARWLACWNSDLANVTKVEVIVTHAGFNAETVSMDDFRLVGEGFISDAAHLQLVREHFDTDASNSDQLSEAQRVQDSDRNGKSDLMQILDDEDPGLYVEIVGVDSAGRAMLRWPAVKGRHYRVERTQDLTGNNGFASVPIDSPVADQPGQMVRSDNSPEPGDGVFFYRAVKE